MFSKRKRGVDSTKNEPFILFILLGIFRYLYLTHKNKKERLQEKFSSSTPGVCESDSVGYNLFIDHLWRDLA